MENHNDNLLSGQAIAHHPSGQGIAFEPPPSLPVADESLILVVDDSRQNCAIIEDMLKQAGYRTRLVQSGQEALNQLASLQPDLMLLDMLMPQMSGLDVCTVVKGDPTHQDLPIIFLTASQEPDHILQAFERGAADYITKPFRPPELLARVQYHLELKHNRAELHRLVNTIHQLNADLEKKVEQRTAQLEQAIAFEATLKRITDKVRDSLDEAQILQTAVQELTQALQIDGCNTGIYDLAKQTSTVEYEYIRSLPSTVGVTYHFNDFPRLYESLLQGQYTQFCWHSAYFGPDCRVSRDYTKNSVLICAIRDDGGTLGDLWLYKRSYAAFEAAEIRLIQQVATQCAIAIRQARLYQKAQIQVEELERLNRLKNDFLSTISHELRTPMANIETMSQLLVGIFERSHLDDAQAKQYFQILHEECQREMSLINDLLDLVHIDAESEPLVPELIHLQSFIPYLVEPFTTRAQQQGQILTLSLADSLPQMESDGSLLRRVMIELLSNACKYTPENGKIGVNVNGEGDRLQITVTNSGVELPDTELERIFDTFYRVPNADPWKHGGTGLGLALAKKQVLYLGGTIEAACKDGQFTIQIQLPLTVPQWGEPVTQPLD